MSMMLMGASYWPVGCFVGNYTLDLPSCRSQVFLCFSGIYEKKKLVELQLSRTVPDVLSEFEVIIIDTAKIKSCFRQKTKPVLSKKLWFHWTRLSFMISMQILVTDIWSSFCRMTELIIQIQRPWKASEMPLALYKWHHKRQLIYVPPKKQSSKNNCQLYNNLVSIIFGSA